MPLKHTIRNDGRSITVSLAGDFTFSENGAFRQVVAEVTAAEPRDVTVDLSGLGTVDSAGLSMLVLLRDRLSKGGATITLRHPPAQVSRILDVVDFGKLFTIIR